MFLSSLPRKTRQSAIMKLPNYRGSASGIRTRILLIFRSSVARRNHWATAVMIGSLAIHLQSSVILGWDCFSNYGNYVTGVTWNGYPKCIIFGLSSITVQFSRICALMFPSDNCWSQCCSFQGFQNKLASLTCLLSHLPSSVLNIL